MTEAEILLGLKNRDLQAFNMLFDRYFALLQYYAEQITRDELEAEDIAIHSLAKLWEQELSSFGTMDKVKNFIFNITKNSSIDFLRKEKTRHLHQANIAYLTTTTEEDYLIERSNYEFEMLAKIYAEMDQLATRTREVFIMVYIRNIDRKEVANQLGISLITVHRLCSEAMHKLKRKFSEKELLLVLFLVSFCKN